MTLRLALPLLLSMAAPATALELDAMTDAERTAFRAEVRAYLLDNPEVLQEAIGVLQEREQQAELARDEEMAKANTVALTGDGHSFVGGNLEGDITIVEFMDYRCGFCRKAFPEVEELISTDANIRYIIKEFPILGEQSTLASQFAIATKLVAGDATYKDVHNTLMEFRGEINAESLTRIGDTLALDTAAINAMMDSEEVSTIIAQNRELAQQLQISGTPTFVIEDQMVRGYVPLAEMESMVAELRSN